MSQEIDFLARIQGQPDYPILPDTDRLEIDSLVREYAGIGMTADLRRRARSQLIRLQENHAFLDAGQSAELRKILKPRTDPLVILAVVFLIIAAIIVIYS